jgi:membrane protein implicated in regulation of membrane protease activity
VPQSQSSILTEIAWLGFFLVVFIAAVYVLVRTLVPHHFNDKIAIVLAAIVAGLVMIGVRAWFGSRLRER